MSVFLAIETSQRLASVASRAPSGSIHVEYLCANKGGRHGDDLMPAIDRLFKRIEQDPSALKIVAVSIGPGGFTGLRIAVSTAKMFAEVLGVKVFAVPSALVAGENVDLSAIESQSSDNSERILVALASKHETFWATRLERCDGVWCIAGEPAIVEAGSFDITGLAALVADEHLPATARKLAEAAHVPVIPPHFDASACLRVAERLAEAGSFVDAVALGPQYPRQPEAVTIWQSRHSPSSSR